MDYQEAYEKVETGMRCCVKDQHKECPYFWNGGDCVKALFAETLHLIREQRKMIAELQGENKSAE